MTTCCPARDFGVTIPVALSKTGVEAPLLELKEGTAVTLINWNNEPIEDPEITIKDVTGIKKIASATHGQSRFR